VKPVAALLLAGALGAAAPACAAPTASKALFGMAADGARVDLITLRNDSGMTVKISTRGGTITEIDVPDRTGKMGNVILGVRGFDAWERMIGYNAITGRYANRIGGGGFTLDGVFYKLPTNQNGVILHGGAAGFSSKLFAAETFVKDGRGGATLTVVSPDGENGFPGTLSLGVTYSLGNDDVLRLEFQATATRPTVINLTNHAYFTLGTHSSGPVYDQLLQVFASKWTPTDQFQVPTGELRPVAGTPFDFRKARPLLPTIYSSDPQIMLARGLDHNFVLDGPSGGAPRLALRLTDPKSGRQLEVRTSEPAVQLYSTNGAGGIDAGDGLTIRQSDALAIETEHFPDSPNKPDFPSTVLRPGETFKSVTEFAFSTDKEPFPK
jgi:aldose 1-epimerase